MNDQNLIPFQSRSESETRALGVKGGKASGEARRRKKSMGQLLNQYLDFKITNEQVVAKMMALGYSKEECDNRVAFMMSLVQNSQKGNSRMAEIVMEKIKDDEECELRKKKLKLEIERMKLENEILRNKIEGRTDNEDLTPLAYMINHPGERPSENVTEEGDDDGN